MVLTAPEFVVPELVQVLHEVEIAAELQHRVLPDGMVGGEKGAKMQTRHAVVSWLVLVWRQSAVECPSARTDRVAQGVLYQICPPSQRRIFCGQARPHQRIHDFATELLPCAQ
jgi:hypothetical protein